MNGIDGASVIRTRMHADERRELIVDLLREQGFATLSEIMRVARTSEATTRRDLVELEREGIAVRSRGGAKAVRHPSTLEENFEMRRRRDRREKRIIGRLAVDLLEDGATVFLNDGSTAFAAAQCMVRRRLTVITSALNIAQFLAPSETITVLVVGGLFRETSFGMIGPMAVGAISELHADAAVLGIDGITADGGVFLRNIDDAAIARAMSANADCTTILASPQKIGRSALAHVADWSDVDHLAAAALPPGMKEHVCRCGVSVVLPQVE